MQCAVVLTGKDKRRVHVFEQPVRILKYPSENKLLLLRLSMLGEGKSKVNWQETSGMHCVHSDKVFWLTWFILLQKSSLAAVTSVPVTKRGPESYNCDAKNGSRNEGVVFRLES